MVAKHFTTTFSDNQWVVTCLDFNLAVQDNTLEGAWRRIGEQIELYFETISSLDNDKDKNQLLKRRAPIADWISYYLTKLLLLLNK